MPTDLAEIVQNADQSAPHGAGARVWRDVLGDALAVALGCALTLAIHGYRFGEGNHTIYLLDAMRRADPALLRNDWFVTQTLQYHALFGWIAAQLFKLRAIEPVFFAGYVLLVILFHVAWLKIVKQLDGRRGAYLVSLALYYASAAGTGLGVYQFFQDSSLLPSNVANVAMLWAVYFWIAGRFAASGACIGVAGVFHLNYAVVGVVMWVSLCVWDGYTAHRRTLSSAPHLPRRGNPLGTGKGRSIVAGSLLALVPAIVNIVLAAQVTLRSADSMPLAEFVDLYVRLRHPHHYEPSSWPTGLWLSFLWSIPFAFFLLWRADERCDRGRQVLGFMCALQIVALLGAGVWYVNESLVQMSLYRFSIFAQLLGCIVVGTLVAQRLGDRIAGACAAIACAAMIAVCVLRGPFFGAFVMPGDDAEYLAVCDWVRNNSPVDAVFLVPPGESSFRLRAQRAIVINFKAVPQLGGELPEWRDRLRAVLGIDDLMTLPRGYPQTLRAIDQRYASRSADELAGVARRYGARFIVTPHTFAQRDDVRLVFSSPAHRYFVYDLARTEEQRE